MVGGRDCYVLVVDDDPDMLESIETVLTNSGHQVVLAGDGPQALATLSSRRPLPCLVLLDLMMPEMNGFEVRAQMLATPSLADVPVVALTGAGRLAEQRSGELRAPILRKPMSRLDLLRVVSDFCGEPGSG
jgi:CheY-like chemotaxis protein